MEGLRLFGNSPTQPEEIKTEKTEHEFNYHITTSLEISGKNNKTTIIDYLVTVTLQWPQCQKQLI